MKQSSRRQRLHQSIRQEIKTVALQQIGREGASALSLRHIAKEMGLTAPALYRYYPSRDHLVTDLIVDAFNSLGDALRVACDACPLTAHASRFAASGFAYRDWALQHSEQYNLIFGTPIKGYFAPAEITMPVAANALGVLIQTIADAYQAGVLNLPPEYADLPPNLEQGILVWREAAGHLASPVVLNLAFISWARVHGLVSLELYNQVPPGLDPAEIFQIEIRALLHQLGMNTET